MRTVIPAHHPSQERDPASLTALNRAIPKLAFGQHPLLRLQRTIGNQATLRMLKDQGHEFGNFPAASIEPAEVLNPVQIHASAAPAIQTKLTVNEPGDEHEQEADRIADQVMRMPAPAHAPLTASASPVSLQPKCACGGTCDKCQVNRKDEDHEELHRSPAEASNLSHTTAPPIVEEVLRSPGEPLHPETRAFMEPRFGQDFGGVRVHADSAAAKSAESVNAQAYTVENHVAFSANQYAPSTTSGKALLAHELTHVVQQAGDAVGLQRRPAHATMVPIDDIEQAKPGSMHPDDSSFKAATVGTELVHIRDEDARKIDTLSLNDVRNSPAYVDNGIVSVGAEWPPFAPMMTNLLFKYTDNHIAAIPMGIIDLNSAARSDQFLRRQGVIYPLAAGGAYTYDAQNTPNIIRGAQMKLDLFYKLAERRLMFAQMVFSFQLMVGGLAGAASGIPEGRIRTSPNFALEGGVAEEAGAAAETTRQPYVNNNPRALPSETESGAFLNDAARAGKIKGVSRVEGAPEMDVRSGDYRFVKPDGTKVGADLYEPRTMNTRSIVANIYEKSGQAEVAVVRLGEGTSGQLSVAQAESIARDVIATPGHSIARVIVLKGGQIIVDLP
jgi:hypothetical protein